MFRRALAAGKQRLMVVAATAPSVAPSSTGGVSSSSLCATSSPLRFSSTTTSAASQKTGADRNSKNKRDTPKKKRGFDSINPLDTPYKMDFAFDEPYMKFLFEGRDVDVKQHIRDALLKIVPTRTDGNFTAKSMRCGATEAQTNTSLWMSPQHLRVLKQLQALGIQGLASYAQVMSTPEKLLSFYEVLATCDMSLAVSAAEHLTFGGLVATHGTTDMQREILDGVDSFQRMGTIALHEVIADGECPLNCEARWDSIDRCFYLRGASKFAIVNAASAQWAAVLATTTAGMQAHQGTHLFFVRLRNDKGELMPGVQVRPILNEGSATLEGSGVGVIHFHHVPLQPSQLMKNYEVQRTGEVTLRDGMADLPALTLVRGRRRLATGALYAGVLKAMVTSVNQFVSKKYVVGPDGDRDFPFYGIQHVQTPLVSCLIKFIGYLCAWQHAHALYCDTTRAPTLEDETKIASVVHHFQDTILELADLANRLMGVHASLESTLVRDAVAVVSLRREGTDSSALIREVAMNCVVGNVGTAHWGWKAASIFSKVGFVDRFLKNPMYSPRVADLSRHLLFFSHKHYATKKRLRQSREMERRKGGPEHQWYDWTMFRHEQVRHCGEAYMEMLVLESLLKEMEKGYDPRGRKVLRDVGWVYAVARQHDNLTYYLQSKMISLRMGLVVQQHLDNIVTVSAAQTVNLVTALQVPPAWHSPAALRLESYWTIPGTAGGIERGSEVVEHKAPHHQDSDKKSDHEFVKEEEEDFDLLHGLDKKK